MSQIFSTPAVRRDFIYLKEYISHSQRSDSIWITGMYPVSQDPAQHSAVPRQVPQPMSSRTPWVNCALHNKALSQGKAMGITQQALHKGSFCSFPKSDITQLLPSAGRSFWQEAPYKHQSSTSHSTKQTRLVLWGWIPSGETWFHWPGTVASDACCPPVSGWLSDGRGRLSRTESMKVR